MPYRDIEKVKVWRKDYWLKNKERLLEYHRNYRLEHGDRRKQLRLSYRFTRFSTTKEWYDETLRKQNGTCAYPLCGKSVEIYGRSLAIDHDHKCCPGIKSCGKCLRGILCSRHNIMLGDDIDFHRWAITWLGKNND